MDGYSVDREGQRTILHPSGGGTDLHFARVGPSHGDSPEIDGFRMYDVPQPDLTTNSGADKSRRSLEGPSKRLDGA